ncbi:MAG: MauE/DoxX family redox-associated membrane protein [Bacteroidota bacterium]
MKKACRIVFALFFIVAGINHFLSPSFYYPLIPDYIPFPGLVNFLAGAAEILLGVALLIPATRFFAGIGIAGLMVFFIPAHVYFVAQGSCIENSLCVSPVLGWVRLVLVQPLLIWLGWYFRKN